MAIDQKATIPAETQTSIDRHVRTGAPGGSFIEAVLANNLREAVTKADLTNLRGLHATVLYCNNHLPPESWGSPEAVEAWRSRPEIVAARRGG